MSGVEQVSRRHGLRARGGDSLAAALRMLATAVLLLALAGCARDDAATTLKFWTFGREGEVVGELLADFERAHPGVHVVVQNLPLSAAHEKLLTAFAGDALPDLCQLGNTWVPEFAALGALAPLQPDVAASAVVRADDYFPGIWDTNLIDGSLYGVPWYVDTRLAFYRKDLLSEAGVETPPRTWSEWARAMTAVKARGGSQKFAVFLPLNEFEPLLNLAIQQPDPLLRDNDTRGNFESAGFRRAIAFYADAFARGWAPPMSNTQISNVWDEFGNGLFAFYISGPWNIGEFNRRLPPDMAGRWGTLALPGVAGPGGGAAGGSSLAIFESSRHKKLAWQLAEFLSEVPQQQRFFALTGDLPARRSAWAVAGLANDELAKPFREQLELVKPTPKVPEWERIANEMQLAAERVVRGGVGADDALRDLDATVDAILAKRRALLAGRKHD